MEVFKQVSSKFSRLSAYHSFRVKNCITPSNENIISGSWDTTIKVWNQKTFQLIAYLTGHSSFIIKLVIIASNENIVSGSNDKTIKV
jgi:WD40 repeat protein